MKYFGCLLFWMSLTFYAQAQTVRNVKASQEGQNIVITYELVCSQPTEINLFLSEDNAKNWSGLKTGVSGDVGSRITQGNKVIYWDVLQSKDKLVGNAFVFKVKVGEEFKTVKIGNQVWMAENLNVDHYRNGDPIPEVKDDNQWSKLNSGAWCYYDNEVANGKIYGKLYNWYAVNDARGLCPVGWHVPSDAQWTILENYLGGNEVAGGGMKSITGWDSPNTGSTNSSGFNAIPAGYRNILGIYYYIGEAAVWWGSIEDYSSGAWPRDLYYNFSNLFRGKYNKNDGFSIRCIKD
jgi:uncharacterized protein (TIGR02145 family)